VTAPHRGEGDHRQKSDEGDREVHPHEDEDPLGRLAEIPNREVGSKKDQCYHSGGSQVEPRRLRTDSGYDGPTERCSENAESGQLGVIGKPKVGVVTNRREDGNTDVSEESVHDEGSDKGDHGRQNHRPRRG
jgi:hypothetical protein